MDSQLRSASDSSCLRRRRLVMMVMGNDCRRTPQADTWMNSWCEVKLWLSMSCTREISQMTGTECRGTNTPNRCSWAEAACVQKERNKRAPDVFIPKEDSRMQGLPAKLGLVRLLFGFSTQQQLKWDCPIVLNWRSTFWVLSQDRINVRLMRDWECTSNAGRQILAAVCTSFTVANL